MSVAAVTSSAPTTVESPRSMSLMSFRVGMPLTSMVTVPPKSFEASRATSTPATRFVVVVTVRVPVLSVMLPAVALRSPSLC